MFSLCTYHSAFIVVLKPTVVIVGRPNVGKSTLFNRLTRSRDAIVVDVPGSTRDRNYGEGRIGGRAFLVVDTGGFEPVTRSGILVEMARQTRQAVDEADIVLFVVDAREGLAVQDREIARELRESSRKVLVVVNKAEGRPPAIAAMEFHELGLGEPVAISAAHGEGVSDLVDLALADFPAEGDVPDASDGAPKIAIVGRPNVGKSTLVNALLGADRMLVFDEPGTTRDAIHVEFEWEGRPYTLIDTAGLRRRGRATETTERFSVIKTMQAIAEANVAILVLDARQGIADQDAHVASFILNAGRAVVVAVNKWERLPAAERDEAKRVLARRLGFMDFAATHFVSALEQTGMRALMASVDVAYQSAMARLSTPRLTRALQAAVARQAPPRAGVVRPKPRYAHQGGVNPPRVVIHGNALENLPDSYRRYLERFFSEAFKLVGTPLRIELRSGRNPYAGGRRRR